MFFPVFYSLATGFLFSGIFAALPITSWALLAFCLQSSFASQTMALCRAFLATSSLSFVFYLALLFSKVFCFASFAAFFSHCLVLFPGHPFFIFTCFSRCVFRLPNLFSSSFSFCTIYIFVLIPVWSIYFYLYLSSIYFPANFALFCGYLVSCICILRHMYLFVILFIAALFCLPICIFNLLIMIFCRYFPFLCVFSCASSHIVSYPFQW